jgi:methionyl-tRNA synthetase
MRVAAVLSRPIVPSGSEMIAEHFALDTDFFSWDNISAPINELCPDGHKFKFLEPRSDFFCRHPSQLEG